MGNDICRCKEKKTKAIDDENPQETNESNGSSSKILSEGNCLPKPHILKNKLIKKIPNEEKKRQENPMYDFPKDLLDSEDLEKIFKIGLDRQILQFYDKVLDEKPKAFHNFLLSEALKKNRFLEMRNHEEDEEKEKDEEEENALSPLENEEAHEDKEKAPPENSDL